MGAGLTAFFLAVLALVTPRADTRVNAVIGDASWAYSTPPESASEVVRIRTHLTFVLDALRRVDTSQLPPSHRALRNAALVDLQRYAERGQFPRRHGADGYAGRRPRFVDDRGVWCAVGQLIVDSGEVALAERIAKTHEYDYLLDIEDRELAEWEGAHGFSARELAIIQPQYDFITPEELAKYAITDVTGSLTRECATESIPTTVNLSINDARSGRLSVTTESTDPFSQCFAVKARRYVGFGSSSFSMEVKPPRIAALIDDVLRPDGATECLPQPGPIPTTASYRVHATKAGIDVIPTSSPRNEAFEQCLVADVRTRLKMFVSGGPWDVTIERKFNPTSIGTEHVRSNVDFYVSNAATDCYPPTGAPKKLTAAVSAQVDDLDFKIELDAKPSVFATCVKESIRTMLREEFTVKRPPGFRIDAVIHSRATVEVVSAKERSERMKREWDKKDHGIHTFH